jgi:hypothetical protein
LKAAGHWTVQELFSERPGAFMLFEKVRLFIESIGPVTSEVTKQQAITSQYPARLRNTQVHGLFQSRQSLPVRA